MGGDTGGNDCVHVIDVRVDHAAMRTLGEPDDFLSTTDVVIHDEHGNVCQFTYQEWHAFRLKMADGTFDHIGDYVSPEDVVPIASATGTPATLALGVATVKAPECESCAGTGYSGDSATPNGGCWDCRGTGLYNGGEL